MPLAKEYSVTSRIYPAKSLRSTKVFDPFAYKAKG